MGLLSLVVAGACGNDVKETPDGASGELDGGVIVDELSMPAEPTVDDSKFLGAATCGNCHERHYKEWRTSMHSYAMIDPVYRAAVKVRQEEKGGLEDPFCLQCHTPIGTRSHDIRPGFDFDQLKPITLEVPFL